MPPNASPCSGFAFTEQAVWTPSCEDTTTLVRIDPATNEVVATIDLGGWSDNPPEVIDGYPWLVVESPGGGPARLARIDPASNSIDRVISLDDAFTRGVLVTAAGSAWVTDWANDQVFRLPMTAFAP